jgi:hypothetical protein
MAAADKGLQLGGIIRQAPARRGMALGDLLLGEASLDAGRVASRMPL